MSCKYQSGGDSIQTCRSFNAINRVSKQGIQADYSPQRDNDELRILSSVLDIISNN